MFSLLCINLKRFDSLSELANFIINFAQVRLKVFLKHLKRHRLSKFYLRYPIVLWQKILVRLLRKAQFYHSVKESFSRPGLVASS
jgi:hypothetical protein